MSSPITTSSSVGIPDELAPPCDSLLNLLSNFWWVSSDVVVLGTSIRLFWSKSWALALMFFAVSPLQHVSDSLRDADVSVLHSMAEHSVLSDQNLHSGPAFLVVMYILECTIPGN